MNTTIKSIVIIAVSLLLIAGLYMYIQKDKKGSAVSTPNEQMENKKLTKADDTLTVNVVYPVIPGSGKEIVGANASIENDIYTQVLSFEKEAQENKQLDIDLPKDIRSTVAGSPSVEEKNERYISIFMGIEWYMRGAAHPYHSIAVYVYDYHQKKLVTAVDFFKEGSNYLNVLSKLSQEDLLVQSKMGDMGFMYDKEMVETGTVPTKENFSKLLPMKDGLVVYFDEYQVAPYAAGPQQVVIPYAKLKDIIDTESVLGFYFK